MIIIRKALTKKSTSISLGLLILVATPVFAADTLSVQRVGKPEIMSCHLSQMTTAVTRGHCLLASLGGRLKRPSIYLGELTDETKLKEAQAASNNGDIVTIQRMMDHDGLDVNQSIYPTGNTLLLGATYWGRTAEVRFLISKGANVNYAYPVSGDSNEGFTALINVVNYSHWDIVRVLLDAGANANACDAHGVSVRDHARQNAAPEWVMRLLREHNRAD